MRVLSICLVILVLSGGCHQHNPTEPDPYKVILVDTKNPTALSPPCGTVEAVCGTITDGLISAALLQVATPTILVKSGIYDREPVYPLQLDFPVTLKSEDKYGASLISATTALVVTSSEVRIEGFQITADGRDKTTAIEVNGGKVVLIETQIISHSLRGWSSGEGLLAIGVTIDNGGYVSLNNNQITANGIGVKVFNGMAEFDKSHIAAEVRVFSGGHAKFEHNEIDSNVWVLGGEITLIDNVVTGCWGNPAISIIQGGYGTLRGNTIDGSIAVDDDGTEIILTDNTIYGNIYAFVGANLMLDGNTIRNEDDTSEYTIEILSATARLTNNTHYRG